MGAVFATLTGKDAQGQCAKCHSVDRNLDGRAVVNWTPRRVCAECHTAEAAGETCVLCHNYHVYRVHMPFLRTGLPGSARPSSNPSAK